MASFASPALLIVVAILISAKIKTALANQVATRAMIIGGEAGGNHNLKSVEIFDAHEKMFHDGVDLPSGRQFLVAATLGNAVYAIGGKNETDRPLTVADRLRVWQTSWQAATSLPAARQKMAIAPASPTSAFVVGGEAENGYLNTLERFDVNNTARTQTWTPLSGMSTARSLLAAGVIGDTLYAAGGVSTSGTLNTVEKYSLASGVWSSAAPMQQARVQPCSAVLDGKFYVIGGHANGFDFASVEVYDPKSDVWSAIAPMSNRRRGCGAAVVGGVIHVFGGYDGLRGRYDEEVEVYDATDGEWLTLSAEMKVPRTYFGIAVLA